MLGMAPNVVRGPQRRPESRSKPKGACDMTSLSGPWTTALHCGATAKLSTFWKRRMTMLSLLSRSPAALTRRAAMLLLVAGAAACALPTLEIRPAEAEPPGGTKAEKSKGRIFLDIFSRTDDSF